MIFHTPERDNPGRISHALSMKLLLLVAFYFVCLSAHASMWEDPGFEEMLENSTLIAVVEVQADGKFSCPVNAVDVLKGTAPAGKFTLAGYNDEQMEERGIEAETLHKGDRVLAFMRPLEKAPEERKAGDKAIFLVPTPSCGDFVIRGGRIRGGCYLHTYPLRYPAIETSTVVELVRGAVQRRAGKEPQAARKLIGEKLTIAALEAVTEADTEENIAAEWTLHWLLWAAGDYGGAAPEVVIKAAVSGSPVVQITAGRALRRLPADDKTLAAAAALLRSRHSYAQGEAVRVLLAGAGFDRAKCVEALLKALPDSSSAGRSPGNIMDPIRNVDASGRELMIRAIGHYKAAAEAESVLVALIKDEGLSEGVFTALRDHFLAHRSDAARARFLELLSRCPDEALTIFLSYAGNERSKESLAAVSARLTQPEINPYQLAAAVETLAAQKPLPEEFVAKLSGNICKAHAKEGRVIEAAVQWLISHRTPRTLQDAARLVLAGPLEDYVLDSAAENLAQCENPALPDRAKFLSAVLDKIAAAKSEEPQANQSVNACIRAADKTLLTRVQSLPARLFHERVQALAVDAMKLKLTPAPGAAQEVTAWCELIARDDGLGYATPHLVHELRRAAGATLRSHAAAELERLLKDPDEEMQALIKELKQPPAARQ